MKNVLLKMSVGVLALVFFASCSQINKLSLMPKKPFEERTFDAKLWREGDAQTRGEMIKDLRSKKTDNGRYLLYESLTRQEVVEIFGEPDRKTRGRCCGAGGTFDEEVWLYELETAEPGGNLRPLHLQMYFSEDGEIDATRVALWDDKNPDYFPRVG